MNRTLRQAAARRLDAFLRDERGTIIAEFVIIMPILLWTLVATFSYWDVYRSMNRVQKAAFTVADNVSRLDGSVTSAYINGLGTMLNYLIDRGQTATLRVSSIVWVATEGGLEGEGRYEVMWSCSPNRAMPIHTTDNLTVATTGRLPTLTDLETVLLIEAAVPYKTPLGIDSVVGIEVGVDDQAFREFVFLKPRFIGKIDLAGPACT